MNQDPARQVLVTIQSPGVRTRSYLIDSTGQRVGIDPNYFLDRVPERTHVRWFPPQKQSVRSRITASLLVSIAVLIGIAGITQSLSVRVVLTGSMAPSINPGDAIVTITDAVREPAIGDVVVYTAKRFDGTSVAPFAHRIIGGDATNGWVLRGDANPAADIQKPTAQDISGVVVATIPQAGKFISPQLIMALLIAGFAMWLISDGLGSD